MRPSEYFSQCPDNTGNRRYRSTNEKLEVCYRLGLVPLQSILVWSKLRNSTCDIDIESFTCCYVFVEFIYSQTRTLVWSINNRKGTFLLLHIEVLLWNYKQAKNQLKVCESLKIKTDKPFSFSRVRKCQHFWTRSSLLRIYHVSLHDSYQTCYVLLI